MEYGTKIREQREAPHLSQSQLAEQLSITRQTLSRWESGAAKPDVDSLGKMAAIFGVKSDYFFQENSSQHVMPLYQKAEVEKQKRQLIALLVISIFLILGALALVIYGSLAQQTGLIAGGGVALPLFVLILFWVISIARNVFANARFAQDGDEEALLAFFLKRYARAQGSKESYANVIAACYLDLDQLDEARKYAALIQTPLLKDLAAPTLILLDLDEGRYSEAKALYLVYAPHHRQGHSQSESHMVSALSGLFHVLDGEEASPEEARDYAEIFDCALGKKLWASAPWKKEKRQGEEVAKEQSKITQESLTPQQNAFDVMAGQGERKLQSWLNFVFAMSIVVFLTCFLIGALTVSAQEARPLRNMWVMAFGALAGLFDMIYGIRVHQKEPKDHTLYAIIGGTIIMVFGILLALTALA